MKYPEIIDDDDLRVVQPERQRNYHFFEWLSAIKLFEKTGYLSLLETYLAKNHPRKRAIVQNIVSDRVFAWMDNHQPGHPDLFVYCLKSLNWYFCEVKGLTDRVRENQREWLTDFSVVMQEEGLSMEGRVLLVRVVEGDS